MQKNSSKTPRILDYSEVRKVQLSFFEQIGIAILTLFIIPFEIVFQIIRTSFIMLLCPNRILDRLSLHFRIVKHLKANP